jgi:DNA polymerase IV
MGWDEAFIAVETADPEALAREIQARVRERTELWCTIGIGDNKLQAKIATEMGKPAGVFTLTSDQWHQVMDPQPVDALWGLGNKTAQKLAVMGIRTVGELAATPVETLADRFGPSTGPWFASLARGEGDRSVSGEPYVSKAVSREHTFQRDLSTREEIERELDRIARQTAEDVANDGRAAARIVVKVRFAPFTTKTRGVQLPEPARDADAIASASRAALERFPHLDRPVRLLGVRAEFAAVPE